MALKYKLDDPADLAGLENVYDDEMISDFDKSVAAGPKPVAGKGTLMSNRSVFNSIGRAVSSKYQSQGRPVQHPTKPPTTARNVQNNIINDSLVSAVKGRK